MTATLSPLAELGWSHFFRQQLSPEEMQTAIPVRVFAINRQLLEGVDRHGRRQFSLPRAWLGLDVEALPTVGDWLLLDPAGQPIRLLQRSSLFKRMASGRDARVQLMAANVDTLFIVTSCNQDFNLSRLERYLALALDAGVEPVIILTRADQSGNVDDFCQQARSLRADLAVVAVNAKSAGAAESLKPWCSRGKTVALVGSSGVGKSTLVNTLSATQAQETGAVREGDAKGRHTTTSRSLHLLPGGGLLLDSPGLRELQLSDCAEGVAALFEEIETVALGCRIRDCRHQGETGCAVIAAAERNELEPRRLTNYLKLRAEQEHMAQTLVEKRRKAKKSGKMCKQVLAGKRREKGF